MNKRMIFRLIRYGAACLAASALLWSWIFTFVTDAPPENKITLYADMRAFRWTELAIALEEDAPEGIRFIQVRPFAHALMDSGPLTRADLYVMTEAQAAERREWIGPPPGEEEREGPPRGILLYDPQTGEGCAESFLNYGERPGERWYLYFGRQSPHAGERGGAAEETARRLTALP